MATRQISTVQGYELRTDRAYDTGSHLWVESRARGRARVGFDPLGRETSGDVVQLSFEPRGTRLRRGEPFGTIEAAKFVGPLTSPVSGEVVAVNDEVVANPGLVNDDPEPHWLVEFELADAAELGLLVTGEASVTEWFAREVERFRSRGAIAE